MSDEDTCALMLLHVGTLVPLFIHAYLKDGGVDELHFAKARNTLAWNIAAHGDALLYRIEGKTAETMDSLIEGLAILSFCPGGVTFLGMHFEATDIARQHGITLEPIESEAGDVQ